MENGKYKYELHCHTDETSVCGKVPGAQIPGIYKARGYDGVVITDHYSSMTYPGFEKFRADKSEKQMRGYNAAKQAAGDDFTVLLGIEYRGFCSFIDYLIFGVTEDFLRKNLMFKYIRRISKYTRKNGMLIVAPHPMRIKPFLPRAKYIDGAEIVNSKESDENNKAALEWAKKKGIKILTTGSDFHRPEHDSFRGILTDEPIKTNDDLIRILKSGKYELIK